MTSFFNFKAEVTHKYDEDIYDLFMESFDALPLSCIVNEKFIAVHGGISPELKSVLYKLFYIISSKIFPILTDFKNLQDRDFSGKK